MIYNQNDYEYQKDYKLKEIERLKKYIDKEEKEMERISSLIGILIEYSTSFQKEATNQLKKHFESFKKSDKFFSTFALKSLIKYLENCKKKDISFDLDFSSIDSTLRNTKNDNNNDYVKYLEAAKKGSHFHIEDRIISLCMDYLRIAEEIKNEKDNIKQLNNELKKFEEKYYKSPSNNKEEHKYTIFPKENKIKEEKVKKMEEKTQQYTVPINQTQKEEEEYTSDIRKAKESLKNFLPTLTNVSETLNSVIEAYKLINKNLKFGKIPNPTDILDLALLIQEILPAYLECKHLLKSNPVLKEFYEKYDIENILNKYTKLYDTYIKNYKLMPNSKKEEQNNIINSYYEKSYYKSKFEKDDFSSPDGCMLTADELRKFVNTKITNDIDSMYPSELSGYFYEDYTQAYSHVPPLNNVTMFMDKDEMAKLYHVIVNKWDSQYLDSEIADASLRKFQFRYVTLLIEKLYSKEIYSLSDEEIKTFINEKYDEICSDILKVPSLKIKSFYK